VKLTGKPGKAAAVRAAKIGSTTTAVERVARVAREHPEALPDIEAGRVTATQVLRPGGVEEAKAAKATGKRKASTDPPASEARDDFEAAIERYGKALEWASAHRGLERFLDLQWQRAPALLDKTQIASDLAALGRAYRTQLERALMDQTTPFASASSPKTLRPE
jgi:hypothetical protein